MNQVSNSQSITHKEGREFDTLGQVKLSLLFMPTLSVYAVFVTVGRNMSTLANVLQKNIYMYVTALTAIYVAALGRN